MNKDRLIKLSGLVLLFFSVTTLFMLFASQLTFAPPGPPDQKWYIILKFCAPLYFISAILIFTSTEWGIKFALGSYIIALFNVLVQYYGYYQRATFYHYDSNPIFFDGGLTFVKLLIVLFFIGFLVLRQLESAEAASVEWRESAFPIGVVVVIIVMVFAQQYGTVLKLISVEGQTRNEARSKLQTLEPGIKNDPRFSRLDVFVHPGGEVGVNGWVENEKDWQALEDLLEASNFEGGYKMWVSIDNPAVTGSPWSRNIHPIIVVNIGYIENEYRQLVPDLLKESGIRQTIKTSKLFGDRSYIFVSPAKREEAVATLMQDSILSHKYVPRSFSPDTMNKGGKTFVDVGFVEMTHMRHMMDVLNKNGIDYVIRKSQYSASNVIHIYVNLSQRARVVDLLKQDFTFMGEYCLFDAP